MNVTTTVAAILLWALFCIGCAEPISPTRTAIPPSDMPTASGGAPFEFNIPAAVSNSDLIVIGSFTQPIYFSISIRLLAPQHQLVRNIGCFFLG